MAVPFLRRLRERGAGGRLPGTSVLGSLLLDAVIALRFNPRVNFRREPAGRSSAAQLDGAGKILQRVDR